MVPAYLLHLRRSTRTGQASCGWTAAGRFPLLSLERRPRHLGIGEARPLALSVPGRTGSASDGHRVLTPEGRMLAALGLCSPGSPPCSPCSGRAHPRVTVGGCARCGVAVLRLCSSAGRRRVMRPAWLGAWLPLWRRTLWPAGGCRGPRMDGAIPQCRRRPGSPPAGSCAPGRHGLQRRYPDALQAATARTYPPTRTGATCPPPMRPTSRCYEVGEHPCGPLFGPPVAAAGHPTPPDALDAHRGVVHRVPLWL